MEIPSRKQVMDKIRAQGGQIAAVLPYHYPRALLRAHNIFPMEVWGPSRVDDMAGAQHFPEYTCKIVQKATRFLMEEVRDAVDCILIPHTCDSLQGMASVMKDFMPRSKPVLTLYHPRGRRPSDLNFLTAELKELSCALSRISGKKPTRDQLRKAMETEEKAAHIFKEIALNRRDYGISDRDYFTLLRSGEYLPAEEFASLAQGIPRGRQKPWGTPIMVSGILADPLELFDAINEFGGQVVSDDLGCVSRRIYSPPGEGDAFRALAAQLMSMPPDPTVSSPYEQRFDAIIHRLKESGAKGLLVYDIKFCEPELFYLPLLEEAVLNEGLGFLHVETELTPRVSQTVLNRINAFLEVIP